MTAWIDPRHKPFAHLERLAAWQRGERPAPVTIEWDLSNRCPYGCEACHFAYTHTRGPWAVRSDRRLPMLHDSGGDLADPSLVSRVLEETHAAGVQGIVWTGGGEPSLHPEALAIWAHAKRVGLAQGLYTLGATLNRLRIAAIRRGFAWVVVSLDAIDPDTYAREKHTPPAMFHRACHAIRELSGGTAVVGVSYLLHGRNYQHIHEMRALAQSLGANYATFRPMITTHPDTPGIPQGDRSWVEHALPVLEDIQGEGDVMVDPSRFTAWANWQQHGYATCYGIRLTTTITPDGRVWMCPNRRGYTGSCLGDLRQQSWAEIWGRHPGQWEDFRECRAMCRLHTVNETLATVYAPRPHEAFI